MTGSLRTIEDIMGAFVVRQLVARWGGIEIHVPMVGAGSTWRALVDALGEEPARKFVAAFGGEKLYIATDHQAAQRLRRIRAIRMRAAGRSAADIARELGCTTRTVFRLLAATGEEPPEETPT